MGIANERYEKQLRAAERERERKKAKMADPAYQQRQKEKRQASAARQLERQQEKRREAALAPKAAPVAIVRKKATRGLKGRTPTADEKRVMTALARLSCVACALHGEDQPLISLHHIDGRTTVFSPSVNGTTSTPHRKRSGRFIPGWFRSTRTVAAGAKRHFLP